MNNLILEKRLLSIIEILSIIIIFIFLFEGTYQWTFYLVFHRCIEILYGLLGSLFFIIAFVIFIYDYMKIFNGNYQYHDYTIPIEIGINGWLNRLLVIIGTLVILNMIFSNAKLK
uniref:MARVEL domain-containing protein n=1 Tax=Strongyloides papillosus TaxID=174720 RepID=A0A0N5BX79_STREA